jgi:hypothetical protein
VGQNLFCMIFPIVKYVYHFWTDRIEYTAKIALLTCIQEQLMARVSSAPSPTYRSFRSMNSYARRMKRFTNLTSSYASKHTQLNMQQLILFCRIQITHATPRTSTCWRRTSLSCATQARSKSVSNRSQNNNR